MKYADYIGRQFGLLTVKSFKLDASRQAIFKCICACGRTSIQRGTNITRVKSCGCRQHPGRHGLADTPEYKVWVQMIQRCTNPNAPKYKNHGGRGIGVAAQWRDFAVFIADVGRRPSNGRMTLERINNDGNYEPGNVEWRSYAAQNRNRRGNFNITHAGKTMCLTDWAKRGVVSITTLRKRILNGWSMKRALSTPASMRGRKVWRAKREGGT